jgi:hypothetical protein
MVMTASVVIYSTPVAVSHRRRLSIVCYIQRSGDGVSLSIELNREAGVTTTRLPAARPTATMLVVSAAAAFLASLDLSS